MIAAHARRTLRRPRVRWAVVALAAGMATGAAYDRVAALFATGLARRWLAVAGPVLVAELVLLWSFLPRHRTDREPSPLGPPTVLTVLRGTLVAFLAGFLVLPRPTEALVWLPAALYGAVALLDSLDGTLARLTDRVTALGSRLDTEIDALGILVASLLAVAYGQLPAWYLLAGAARYLYAVGRWYRRRTGQPVHDRPSRSLSRALAGLQMAFLVAVLSPLVTPPASTVAGAILLGPFLGNFLYDWWLLTGRRPR